MNWTILNLFEHKPSRGGNSTIGRQHHLRMQQILGMFMSQLRSSKKRRYMAMDWWVRSWVISNANTWMPKREKGRRCLKESIHIHHPLKMNKERWYTWEAPFKSNPTGELSKSPVITKFLRQMWLQWQDWPKGFFRRYEESSLNSTLWLM